VGRDHEVRVAVVLEKKLALRGLGSNYSSQRRLVSFD
jgi:hypothetical protein